MWSRETAGSQPLSPSSIASARVTSLLEIFTDVSVSEGRGLDLSADVAVTVSEPKKGTRLWAGWFGLFGSSLKSQGLDAFLKGLILHTDRSLLSWCRLKRTEDCFFSVNKSMTLAVCCALTLLLYRITNIMF